MKRPDVPVPAWKEHYDRERLRRSFFVPIASPETRHDWAAGVMWPSQWPEGVPCGPGAGFWWNDTDR